MQQPEEENEYFKLAAQFINQTNRNIFLTGKAGTGKTTFLKYIKEHSPKKMAIVAPTGVAAINAGGVTIHSLFQFPFGSFLPEQQAADALSEGNFIDRQHLLKRLKLSSAKRTLLQELELLVIDEVSMVRADLLDAIDTVLRHVRRQPYQPFGGLQLLFIGDLFQLPPVVHEQEWRLLAKYYSSPFFHHAKVLQEAPPLLLTLKKVYRQSDDSFIGLLNRLRHNKVQSEDIRLLQSFYRPDFKGEQKRGFITLTTHNSRADKINQEALQQLPGKLYTFNAKTEGEFSENALPAEEKLQLKEGAQILFIKNDKGTPRRYYNGKIGIISSIEEGEIRVKFPEEEEELIVEEESWQNVRYKFNKETEQLEEEVKGTFSQFPIRLAWAITIHKSQGLTFERAVIDASESFAPGQVYVALSRLTSLEGLVLSSPIQPNAIQTDEHALSFTKSELEKEELLQQLEEGRQQYVHHLLLNAFNWGKISQHIGDLKESLEDRKIPLKEAARALFGHLQSRALEQKKTAEKFHLQLEKMLPLARQDSYSKLQERVAAAVAYFKASVLKDLEEPLASHLEDLKKQGGKGKKYRKELIALTSLLKKKKRQLDLILQITDGLQKGTGAEHLLHQILEKQKEVSEQVKEEQTKLNKKQKPVKGESQRLSLQLFKEGKTVEEIASERGLVPGTIEGHLAGFVSSGEIKVEELVSEEKLEAIIQVLEKAPAETSTSEIKAMLGEEFSYGDIKAVQNHLAKGLTESEKGL
ncbi:helix-turn-helix domain-containing protein [Nafulsella turpanensis]|uniref:helix-turn-helix domain-containing protein n=1 Tax=Nafulsella turpanensis TaxID=1265690 RepID=UPI00034700BD|nr:helix-turn-helix domain-containing protein [Nafulsella turpanensis]